ncbi:NAD(P)-dependent alcohol dehydrogenase [uncultured Vibrio sp.]|uniref:zinc-dependent alcohol dehydrogenase family protein n=1 Tax=uncultured Vibrio sp. TaxID=114054 RepID=UPI00260355F3|nr:NAD(P)-dependent alcohol dehydrogenase [uncultured Vibrio sp.]
MTYEQAATLPCAGLTAWHAMFEHQQPLKAGQIVLIEGTGGVSIFALQLASALGIETIVTSSSNEKLNVARSLGATHTINYRERPDWDAAVLELTNGKGVDMVLEVGGAGTLEKSMNAVKIRGVISLIGVLTGFDEKVNTVPITVKMISMYGIHVGSKAMYARFNDALSQHKISPIIDKEFKFSESEKAYDYLESAQHFGKVINTP